MATAVADYIAPRVSVAVEAMHQPPHRSTPDVQVSAIHEAQRLKQPPAEPSTGDVYVPPRISPEAEANYQRWLASLRPWEPRPASGEPRHRGSTSEHEALAGEQEHAHPGSASGGQSVLERYGEQFFSAIGARGGQAVVHERGPEYLHQIGAKGGEATRRKYGPEHYAAIGRKGGQAGRGRTRRRTSPGQLTLPIDQPE